MADTVDEAVDVDAAFPEMRSRARAGDSPKSRRTRARILAEALRLFADQGYAASPNAAIAEAAGLTRGAMLYHFPDRESLVQAAVLHIQSERARLFEAAARTAPSLASVVGPAQEAFDRAQVGPHMFDLVQAGAGPRFQASRDMARFMLEGLARAKLSYDQEGRTRRLLAVVKRAARMLNRKGGDLDLWPES